MAMDPTETADVIVPICSEVDLIHVRQVLRAVATRVGLGLVDQTKLITAGSELGRNILIHATGSKGEMRVRQISSPIRQGVQATFHDDGPGIEDIDLALTDGYSANGSLGLGLPGSKRLVDELNITSAKGTGTTVTITTWRR
jgi:serine/threonine-protein kinase RsbT